MFIRHLLHEFPPTYRLFFYVHLDGMEKTHDLCVEREGVFKEAIEGIQAAKQAGFLVCTNTTIFRQTDLREIRELFKYLTTLGVDGFMISPAYSYAAVQTKEIFMPRTETRQEFQQARNLLNAFKLMTSPIYLEFLSCQRDMRCTAWAHPTFTPTAWKGTCSPPSGAHPATFQD